MKNKKLFIIILSLLNLLFFLFLGCNNYQQTFSLEAVGRSINKFAFIKSNEEDGSIQSESMRYGDLFIYNLSDSVAYRLTDDDNFEIELAWSLDGSKLLFASTMGRKYNFSNPDKSLYPDIYIYNLIDNTDKKINLFYKNTSNFMLISGLSWEREGIYISDEHSISLFSEKGEFIKKIIDLEEQYFINDFIITKNKNYLVFSCNLVTNSLNNLLGIYDLVNLNLNWAPVNGKLMGCGKGIDSFLFENSDSLISYNIEKKLSEIISLPALNDTLILSSANFLNDNKIVFNAIENAVAKGMRIRDRRSRTYIGIYDLNFNTIFYPIKDNCEKECITPYYPKKDY